MNTHLSKLMKMAVMLLLFLLVTAQMRAQAGGGSSNQLCLDGFDPNANGAVYVVVVQPDGKILLGGEFTTLSPTFGMPVTRNHIARLNADGTLDTAFNPNANGEVRSIAVQADGKILVGGGFNGVNSIGGQTRNRIARLDATTGLADSFDPNANNDVLSIAVQADGKILAGGFFNNIGGQPRSGVARLDPTGLVDSFDPNSNGSVQSIAVQADGKILAGGFFTSIGGQTRNHIARLDAATGLADSFNPNANNAVLSIAGQADGKILAGGIFTSIGGQTRNNIARLDATTGLADSFNPDANNAVLSIAAQANGKILVGGVFATIGGQTRNHIARLEAATGLADSFDPKANSDVLSIAVQADGKILAGGAFIALAPNGGAAVTRNGIARLETDGRLDQTLDLNIVVATFVNVYATAVQPDGKILIGGDFTNVLGVARNKIARLNTDGTLDTVFNPNASGPGAYVNSIAVQTDGKILAGGFFTSIGGQPRNDIARLDATTGLADSFNPNATGPNNTVRSIVVQADGQILVGGFFTGIGGQPRNNIARLDATTGLADSFDPNANGIVYAIAVQSDGKILVGGDLTNIGGQTRGRIARLDATTGLADSFDPNASLGVHSIAVQTDGKILAGGTFTSIGGQTRNHIARLDPTTALADSFNPSVAGFIDVTVYTIAVQADGRILVGGNFEAISGYHRARIARLDGMTGLPDSFNPFADNHVFSIAVQADGKVLAGGNFGSMGGHARPSFARLRNDTAALQDLAVAPTSVTWTRGGSSPQLTRVTFEYSNDNVHYTFLGNGIAAGSDWTLTGLNLPTGRNIYVRARGYYSSGYQNGSQSITESVRNAFIPRASSLGNISTRLRIQTGDSALIGGFIITGTEPKTVIMRGIGPSLAMPGALADPIIEVHGPSGQVLGINDNWNDAATRQQIIDSGLAPANALESALWGIILPGPYTVVVRGNNDTTGIGLFEVYDLDQTADSKLGNISTRGFVETGDNVMIGGTIIIGNPPASVLLRAIGPSLANFGVPNVLGDPTLELYDGNGGLVGSNNNWRDDHESEIIATGLPPPNDLESAIVEDLAPGGYTAIVRGSNNTTGVALVEAYSLD